MGVTGCGKSSVGRALAGQLGYDFADADDFHPEANVVKMALGNPLTDEDRWPWLDALGEWMRDRQECVVSCSALREVYRDALLAQASDAVFVHLSAPQAVLEERVRARSRDTDHFAGANLLDSQYVTLEPLAPHERGITVDVSERGVEAVAELALAGLASMNATENPPFA